MSKEFDLKNLTNGWISNDDLDKKDLETIKKLLQEHNDEYCTPQKEDIFNAFKLFPLNETRILILGQDPYPSKGRNKGRAHGFAFSFGNKSKPADSLKNIFIAIQAYKKKCEFDRILNNKDKEIFSWSTNLQSWANTHKVLLLNAVLTYKETEKSKHQAAWNCFIKKIIMKLLTYNSEKMVVFLWGKDAQNLFFESINSIGINDDNNLLIKNKQIIRNVLCLTTGHPTPNHDVVHKYGFSTDAPKQFKQCDDFLGKNDKEQYTWLDFPENNN